MTPLAELLSDYVHNYRLERLGHLAVVRCGVEAVTGGRILQSGDAGNIFGAAISGSQGLVDFDYMVREGTISASINSWQTLKAGLLFGNHQRAALSWPAANIQPSSQEPSSEDPWVERFQSAMDDDLNTSGALAVLFELAKERQRDGNLWFMKGSPNPALIGSCRSGKRCRTWSRYWG